MKINPIGHLVKTNPIQTQSKPVPSAVEWANLKKNECKLLCCGVKLFLLQLRQQDKTNAVSIERHPYEDKSIYPVAA